MNWRDHFRRASGSAQFGAEVGTILGEHTAAELQDFLKSQAYQWGELAKSAAALPQRGAEVEGGRWLADFGATNSNFQAAAGIARAMLDPIPGAAMTMTLLEGPYQTLANASQPLGELDRRYRVALANMGPGAPQAALPPDYQANPQPTAPDWDLGVVKGSGMPKWLANLTDPTGPKTPGGMRIPSWAIPAAIAAAALVIVKVVL